MNNYILSNRYIFSNNCSHWVYNLYPFFHPVIVDSIGQDVIIHPNVEILGHTEIGDFVEILPGSYLNNSKIEDRAIVDSSKVVNSCIEEGSVVGPMSYVSNNKTIK